MKQITLNILAKEILYHLQKPISKVKFAKVIYFVFKNLVIENELSSNIIAFIRMPLGPVPDGFMKLDKDSDITIFQEKVGLVYNRNNYVLTNGVQLELSAFTEKIKNITRNLDKYPTSRLIKISHNEPSWIRFSNGEKYFIDEQDLRIPMPFVDRVLTLPFGIEEQLIQSSLLNGMRKEVVQDSTSLEHPEAYS